MPAKSKSNEIKLTRLYDAPVEAVWDAWTDPEQTAQWWGPRGFTLTTHSKDLRVGGHWHYTMHGPDGTDYPNRTVYHEVEKYQRLVYDHGANDERPPLFRVTVLFKELGDQTEMVMTMRLATPEEAQQTKKFIKDAGGNGTWDRLAEYLAKETSERDIFIITRSFDATPETLFSMWTDAKHFSRWLGPEGTRMEFIKDEIAEGKTSFYKMVYDSGLAMHGKMQYHKIKKPEYLEYTQMFCDETGKASKHPNVPVWPTLMLTRVLLAKEEDGETRLTMMWEPSGEVSPEERRAFAEMRAGMTQGWTAAFDKLELLLLKSSP